VKAQYPQEFSFTLAADADVPYAQIVRVMDVARVQLEGRDFADADALRAAEVRRDAAGRATPLLPDVVLATAR
jgi:hypothetical protein